MPGTASDLARRLADNAEAVCRYYLSNGRREGRYWLVGDVHNTPGRSLYVRLHGPSAGKGAAERWVDAATGEHGDLLDLIRSACNLDGTGTALDEARRFLGLVRSAPRPPSPPPQHRLAHPNRHAGCSVWRRRSRARWPAPTSQHAGLPRREICQPSVSMRIAGTGVCPAAPTMRATRGRR